VEIALWILAGVAVLVGLAGVVLPLLPGTPLLFGGLWLAAWLDGYAKVSGGVVVALGIMALLAWAVDYVAAVLGVKRVGASGLAMAGAGVGTLLGLLGGLPGLIIGPVVGAVAGEWIARKDSTQATRAGLAAGIAFVVAMAAKLGIAAAMLGVFAFAYFV
jgi:uncharacterized protein YqgC (DUF456 family)